MHRATFLIGSALTALACGGSGSEAQSPGTRAVQLEDSSPPEGYVRVQPLFVQSGKGCGLLAERGSLDEAERKLREAAARLGATYVHVTSVKRPAVNHQCLEHEYKLEGVAYRREPPPGATVPAAAETTASAPAPAEATASAPAPASVPAPGAAEGTASAPASTATTLPAPASSGTAPAPERVCIPGATQACLGPGACRGAQACRDDASGFRDCDCGSPATAPSAR